MRWLQKILDFIARIRELFDGPGKDPDAPTPTPPPDDGPLPENPATPPDLPGSISEHWTIGPKEYDSTWRIRWPTTFARSPFNLGHGSYCTCNGARAQFRSYDTDNQSKRPSYTMPLSVPLQAPVTCILFDSAGNAVGWFKAEATRDKGHLP